MAWKMRFKKKININRVVSKIAVTIIALYVGGTILTQLGTIMLNKTSPFYEGLELIGWTVNTTGGITAVDGTGILAVVGIVGIASIVMEFVQFRF